MCRRIICKIRVCVYISLRIIDFWFNLKDYDNININIDHSISENEWPSMCCENSGGFRVKLLTEYSHTHTHKKIALSIELYYELNAGARHAPRV